MKLLKKANAKLIEPQKLENNINKAQTAKQKMQQNFNYDSLNYLIQDNLAKIVQTSSFVNGCHPSNLFVSDQNTLWMSENGMPQTVVIDISNLKTKAKFYQCFGFYCSHAYSSNPSLINLFVSKDGIQFKHWTSLNPVFKEGRQLFAIDPIGPSYKYLEVVIQETFGANRTYMNQLYLLEKHPKFLFQKEQSPTPVKNKYAIKPAPIDLASPVIVQSNQAQINDNQTQSNYLSNNSKTPTKQLQISYMEHQMNNYLQEKHQHKLNMPSEIQNKQQQQLNSSASKKTQTDEDRFLSQDYFSLQSHNHTKDKNNLNLQGSQPMRNKNTPHFNQFNMLIGSQNQNQETENTDSPEYYYDILENVQNNFNGLCEKLKTLQNEFESVQTEFQQSMIKSPIKDPSILLGQISHNRFQNVQQQNLNFNSQFQREDLKVNGQSELTKEHLKNEIMQECMTFCKNQIIQLASQRNYQTSSDQYKLKSPENYSHSNIYQLNQDQVNNTHLEQKLQFIIEDWQKKFFDDYVQPTLQNQYQQMEKKIIMSIEKKVPQPYLSQQQVNPSFNRCSSQNLSTYQASQDKQQLIHRFNNEQKHLQFQQMHHQSSQEDYHKATEQMFDQIDPMSSTSTLCQPVNHLKDTSELMNIQTQEDIKQIAQLLQQKLSVKAQKLRMLQQEQLETDINDDIRSLRDDDPDFN
ncbi:UNKNOWN [Stylonychia lemnae]|uniref:F5/8 type C domain-containing protein n=1 Tax=Stylonychia lemnae TaxID=5949 RepID=A0A078A6X1_STYLE|nr:UNKNOWN [Stylonychia lemnae]|eukprot:CDW77626.1 UNKNOWN [Stylonychia lemnae]